MTLGQLQETLARGGQMLALDPPDAAGLTVGEAFATAAFGPRSHRYGGPRDLVLGVTVRLADGTVARGGGRVVKTVAGYDLPKLVHRRPRPSGRDPGADAAAASAAGVDLHGRHGPVRSDGSRAARPGVRRVRGGRPSGCSCASRARSPGRLPSRPSRWSAATWSRATSRSGPTTASAAAGLEPTRCLPADVPATIERLRDAGATTIVGRYARGFLFSDVKGRGQAPKIPGLAPVARLEQRVVEAYGG